MAVMFSLEERCWKSTDGSVIVDTLSVRLMAKLLDAWDIITFNPGGEIVAKAMVPTPVGEYEVSFWVRGRNVQICPVGQRTCVWSGDFDPDEPIDSESKLRGFVTQKIREAL